MRRALALALVLALGGASAAPARAQEALRVDRETEPSGASLDGYYRALAERRLLAAESGSIEGLREAVRAGEALVVAERWDEAALVLWEATESPRFTDFAETDEMRQAEFMLA